MGIRSPSEPVFHVSVGSILRVKVTTSFTSSFSRSVDHDGSSSCVVDSVDAVFQGESELVIVIGEF